MTLNINWKGEGNSIIQGVDVNIEYPINQIREFIHKFKPKSALEMIEKLEKELNEAGKPIPAELNYLHGLSLLEIGENSNAAFNQLLIAHNSDNVNKNYITQLMKAHFLKNEDNEAKKLLETLLEIDKFNPIGYALDCFYKDTFDVSTVIKSNAKNYQIFKGNLALFYALRNNNRGAFDSIFVEETKNPPDSSFSIDFENKTYAFIYANYRLSNIILSKNKYLFDEIDEKISRHLDLEKAVSFLENVIKKFEDTEKYNYYVSYRCFLACGKYILNPCEITLDKFRTEFDKIGNEDNKNDFVIWLLTAYTQQKQYQKAIEFANLYPTFPFCHFIQSYAYFNLGEKEKSYKTGLLAFEKEDEIEVEMLRNFITFQLFYKFSNEQKESAYYNLQPKFKDENINKVAKFFSISHTLLDEEIRELANFVFSYKDENGNHFQSEVVLQLGFNLQKYELSNQLIEKVIDFSIYSKLYDAYLHNAIYSKKCSPELLELLEKRRTFDVNSDVQFLAKEIELLHLVFDFKQILIVAELGLLTFKETREVNYFAYQKLISLYNLNKKEELKAFIDEYYSIFQQADFEEIKHIVRIFAHVGCFHYLIDTVFDEANKENPEAKEIYFSFITLNQENDLFIHEDMVKNNSWIEIKNLTNSQIMIKEVKNSKKHLNFMEKTVGETVINNSFIREEEFQIIGIYNKYLGLHRKICLEAGDFDSFMTPIIFPEVFDIEILNKIFREKLGKEGDKKEKTHNEYQEKYKRGEIDFYGICKLCRENPIQAYWYVVGQIKEFRTIPSILHRNIEVRKENNFILDFSTIPLLYEIAEKNKIERFDVKFCTSPLVLLKYEQYLEELKSTEEKLSLHVTSDKVEPIFMSKEQTDFNIEYVQNLINWVKANCKIEYARKKLDVIYQLVEKGTIKNINEDFLFNYFIDIVFLKEDENAVLITDDAIYNKHFVNGITISSDYFLNHYFREEYSEKVLPTVLERNYIGVTIDSTTLKSNYLSRKETPILYETTLKNIDSLNSLDVNSFAKVIMLIKYILNDTAISVDEKREETRMILKHFLHNPKVRNTILNTIRDIYCFFICYSAENIEMVISEFCNNENIQ